MMRSDAMRHPSVRRVARVARALGELAADVVFIGGAIAPLLHLDPPFDAPRPTTDVDGVWASSRYADVGLLNERLRALRFRQDPGDMSHIHRWRSPDNDVFDLVPAGDHLGGSGQIWDRFAIETSLTTTLDDGTVIRHSSAPVFLALKWAAYHDRGVHDSLASHDLEDIIALIAARPAIVEETGASPDDVRRFVAAESASLRTHRDVEDLLSGHLNNAQDPARIRERVRDRLTRLASLR